MLYTLISGIFSAIAATLGEGISFILAIFQVLWAIAYPTGQAAFYVVTNIHLIMLFVFKSF